MREIVPVRAQSVAATWGIATRFPASYQCVDIGINGVGLVQWLLVRPTGDYDAMIAAVTMAYAGIADIKGVTPMAHDGDHADCFEIELEYH